jgi:hypothetical protein
VTTQSTLILVPKPVRGASDYAVRTPSAVVVGIDAGPGRTPPKHVANAYLGQGHQPRGCRAADAWSTA